MSCDNNPAEIQVIFCIKNSVFNKQRDLRGNPYWTHNRLKRVLPWCMCTMCREEKSQPQIEHTQYLPLSVVSSRMIQEFLQSAYLLELEKLFEHLRNYSCTSVTCLYILKHFLIGYICFSVKNSTHFEGWESCKLFHRTPVFCRADVWPRIHFRTKKCGSPVHNYFPRSWVKWALKRGVEGFGG
jgi:hypothetical protein